MSGIQANCVRGRTRLDKHTAGEGGPNPRPDFAA